MTLERAIELACRAHAGQVDKSGEPYILHPLRVMLCFSDPQDRIVAVLHDVLEDAPKLLSEIERLVDLDCFKSLLALTRDSNEDYRDYIARVKENDQAKRIKIEDLEDNLKPKRLAKLDSATRERLKNKYWAALEQLEA